MNATPLLTAVGCAVLLAFALSRRSPGAVTSAQLVVYYVLPLLLASASLLSLTLTEESRANLSMTLVSTGLALLLAEFVLAFIPPPNVAESIALDPVAIDSRTALEVARGLTDDGEEAFPHMPASVARTMRVVVDGREMISMSGALANTLTVFCNDTGSWEVYRADTHGFDNDPGVWGFDRPEAVVLGDSYAHGWCVPRQENIASVLAESWPSTINLGISAAGPLTELAIMREFVVDLAPRNVIWLYYEGNDLADLRDEVADPILMRYLEAGFRLNLVEHQTSLDVELENRLRELLRPMESDGEESSALRKLGRSDIDQRWRLPRLARVQSLLLGATVQFPAGQSRLGMLPEVLEAARTMTRQWGGNLYFVYLPAYTRYRSRVGETGTERREVLELVARLQIPIIDIAAAFDELEDPSVMWLHPAAHYSSGGYRTVAEQIVDFVGR